MIMRYFLEVSYNGLAFHGSQLQGQLPTVQGEINRALSLLLRKEVHCFGASRTDEGVHALGNFYHFDTESPLADSFIYRLNAILPVELSVNRMRECVQPEANARFDALSRRYRYRIYSKKDPFLFQRAHYFPYRIGKELLDESAALLLEQSEFRSFAKRKSQTKTYRCHIMQCYWETQGNELHFVVEANRFLRGMVRAMVGTQLLVGRGKISISAFREIIESGDCTRADFSVPGYGLYLVQITYPEAYFLSEL
jgi:tRNA pseudouridine38-40 synthase